MSFLELPEGRKFFTIHEVCRACGISRATLLRLEESGFLKPARIDPYTGYRYYDTQNVTAVGQYQRLQSIGLSRKEITDLYYERVDSEAFIRTLRQKLNSLQHFLNEYEIRHDRSKDYVFTYTTLPAVTCYCTELKAATPYECATKSFFAYEQCLSEGYRVLGSEPLTCLYNSASDTCEDILANIFNFTICIPVIPGQKKDTKLRFFPETEAASLIGYGDIKNIFKLWPRFFEEIKKRELEPSGPPRFISLVAPYAGLHYKPDDYCHECVIPIKQRKE